MLAALIDGLSESGASRGRRRRRRSARRERRRTTGRQSRTAPTWPRCCRSRRCAGATSACCCRCRARASATPRSPRSPTTSSWSASAGTVGRDGDHRAGHRLGLGRDHDHRACSTATSTSSTARRSSSPPASAPTHIVVWATLDKSLGRAAIKSFVVPKGTPGHDGRAARAQARHPGLRHRGDPLRRLPGAGGEPARLAGDRRQEGLRRRDGDLRQHPPARGRDGRRLRPRRRST